MNINMNRLTDFTVKSRGELLIQQAHYVMDPDSLLQVHDTSKATISSGHNGVGINRWSVWRYYSEA